MTTPPSFPVPQHPHKPHACTCSQRSPDYGKHFSLLRPGHNGTHTTFKLRTYESIHEVVQKAALMEGRCKGKREDFLAEDGLCYDDYIFDDKGDCSLRVSVL